MTPLSHYLRELRRKRNLLQKEAAEILGYEQSYLSALETGAKGVPKSNFLNQVIKKLELSESEITKLLIAADKSRRVIKVPLSASCFVYELCHELEQQLPTLTDMQLEMIGLVLRISNKENQVNTSAASVYRADKLNQKEREESKM